MSSSEEKIAKDYLWGLAIILLVAIGSIILISWVVDPLGILREERGFPKLCADGIKTTSDRTSIPLLPLKTNFSQAIIGTSRIKRGFTEEAFGKNALKKTVNLGINGLTMEELYQLSEPLIQSSQLDILWIGLDFGMFGRPKPAKIKVFEKSQTSYNRPLSYLAGALSFEAWRETIFVFKRFHSCGVPIRDYQGFMIRGQYWNKRNNAWNEKSTISDSVKLVEKRLFYKFSTGQPASYQHHLSLLEQLIKKALGHSVQLHVFINPSPPRYFDVLAQAGKLDDYRQWKLDIEALIKNAPPIAMPPKFLDFSGWYAQKNLMPSGCHENFAPPCPFYDFTHYRPHIGMQIVKEFQK